MMRDERRYKFLWMSSILLLLLLMACSKSSSEGGEEPVPKKPMLKIYVFPPDRPIITRAPDLGNVDASKEENEIRSLHVWVFERNANNPGASKLVGHVSLGNVTLSEAGTGEVTMEITDAFAEKLMTSETRPRVDVYVVANVTSANCGLSFDALTKNDVTTESQVDALLIGSSYFGVTSPVKGIPTDGLPMSGVLKDQPIYGTSPVFQVGENLAYVQLVRAVSKMRFIFCKSEANKDDVSIETITLNGGVLPKAEYLFLEDEYKNASTPKWHLNVNSEYTEADYEAQATLVSVPSGTSIATNPSPFSYSYDGKMTGQEYENLINSGVTANPPLLSDLGAFYLRESDQKLMGTIRYAITPVGEAEKTEKTTSFTMSVPGDFSRNHTWIVYGYFITSGDLEVSLVELKKWASSETQEDIYNW